MGDGICRWHIAGLEHLLVQVLLLHGLQFVFQFHVVDRFAELVPGDRLDDLFAKVVLFPEFVPVCTVSPIPNAPILVLNADTYIVSSTLPGVSLP